MCLRHCLLLVWCLVLSLSQPYPQVVPLDLLPLRTEGRWVVDSRGVRFKLKCTNWYGFDSTLFTVGGLHATNISSIVVLITRVGFNCVRLPFSLALYFLDPPVPSHAIVQAVEDGELRNESSGLEVLDATVTHLTDAGLLVLLDNHNSEPSWCCDASQEDGLWFTQRYPEDRWVDALTGITRRYRANRRVIGVELRNEVRDNRVHQVSWGDESEADWHAAAERGGNAVLRADPDALVVVTALCYGSDLRGARDRPVSLETSGRLLWAVHSYDWYFPLTHKYGGYLPPEMHGGEITWLYLGSFLLCLAAVQVVFALLLVCCCGARVGCTDLACAAFTLLALAGVALLVISPGLSRVLADNGCADTGHRDAELLRGSGCGLVAGALVGSALIGMHRLFFARVVSCLRGKYNTVKAVDTEDFPETKTAQHATASAAQRCFPRKRVCSLCLAWLLTLAVVTCLGAFFAITSLSHWRLHAELNQRWGFALEEDQPYTAPVLLSEIGTSRHSPFWDGLGAFMEMNDLDFAYWALNGESWRTSWHDKNSEERWHGESFGVLEKDWASIRAPSRMHLLGLAMDFY